MNRVDHELIETLIDKMENNIMFKTLRTYFNIYRIAFKKSFSQD